MVQLTIDGRRADLHQETIKVSRFNSLLDHFTVRGSVVNDHALPFTSANDAIFGYYRHAQISLPNRQYYAEYSADGYILERGFVNIIDCTETDYIIAFTQNLSEFFGPYQTELLSKMPFGTEAIVEAYDPDPATAKYAFPTIVDPIFYGTNVQAGFNGKINEWVDGSLNSNARVPMLFTKWVFDKIAEITDCKFAGDFFDIDLFTRGIFINTFSLDDASEIVLANHLPDITITDFIFGFRKLFNLAMYIDNLTRTITLNLGEVQMDRPTVLDFTKKVIPSFSRRPELANRLQIDWELDQNDALTKGLPLPETLEKYLAPETQFGTIYEIKSKLSTVAFVDGYATINQIGISNRFGQGNNKFGFRLGIWAGSSNITVDASYHSLAMSGTIANRIPEKFWKNFEKFRAKTAYKKILANLNALDLQKLNWHNNPLAEQSIYIEGKAYYVHSVSTLLPMQGLSELELYEKP